MQKYHEFQRENNFNEDEITAMLDEMVEEVNRSVEDVDTQKIINKYVEQKSPVEVKPVVRKKNIWRIKTNVTSDSKVSTTLLEFPDYVSYYETLIFGGHFDNQQVGENTDKISLALINHGRGVFMIWKRILLNNNIVEKAWNGFVDWITVDEEQKV